MLCSFSTGSESNLSVIILFIIYTIYACVCECVLYIMLFVAELYIAEDRKTGEYNIPALYV